MKKRAAALYLAGALALAAFLWAFPPDLSVAARLSGPAWLAGALALYLFSVAVLALRMRAFLQAIGEKRVPLAGLVRLEFVNRFAYYFLPARLNVPVKALALYKVWGVQRGNALSVTGFEYALDVSVLAVLSFLGGVFFFQELAGDTVWLVPAAAAGAVVLAAAFFAAPVHWFDRALQEADRFRPALAARAAHAGLRLARRVRETWLALLAGKHTAAVVGVVALEWALNAATLTALFLAFGEWVDPLAAALVLAASILVGGLSQVPGGVGVREAAMVVLFGALGVDAELATAVVLLRRALDLAGVGLGYAASLGLAVNVLDEGAR